MSLLWKVSRAVEREGPLGNMLLELNNVFTLHSLSSEDRACALGALTITAMCQQCHTDAKISKDIIDI